MRCIIIAASVTMALATMPALADVASVDLTSPPGAPMAHTQIIGFNNLVVGAGAARSLRDGSCDIIIGHADVPTPGTSYYLNIDGKVYPNSARWDPEFQSLAMRRAAELAIDIGIALDPTSINAYFAKDFCVPAN